MNMLKTQTAGMFLTLLWSSHAFPSLTENAGEILTKLLTDIDEDV